MGKTTKPSGVYNQADVGYCPGTEFRLQAVPWVSITPCRVNAELQTTKPPFGGNSCQFVESESQAFRKNRRCFSLMDMPSFSITASMSSQTLRFSLIAWLRNRYAG